MARPLSLIRQLFYIFTVCCIIGVAQDLEKSKRCRTWASTQTCETCNKACKLPVVLNGSQQMVLERIMEKNKIGITWLSLHRSITTEFLWLDCTLPDPTGTFAKEQWGMGENCAFLDLHKNTFNASKCSTGNKGVLCQTRDCKRCSSIGYHHIHCFKINQTCYIKSSARSNWEQAKAYCYSRGWELAVFSEVKEADVLNKMTIWGPDNREKRNSQQHFWIGLRKEEWVYDTENEALNSMENVFWGVGEPRDSDHCAVVERNVNGHYEWRVASCGANYPALCLKNGDLQSREYLEMKPTNNYNVSGGAQLDIDMQLDERVQEVKLHKCSTWVRVAEQCDSCSTGCKLPVILNASDQERVTEFMQKKYLQASWLGLQRVRFGDFLWLDCTTPKGQFLRRPWYTNCAYLNTRDTQIDAGMCVLSNKGAICEAQDCRSCSQIGLASSHCHAIKSVCYVRNSMRMNWEQAKAYCAHRGWQLAVFGGPEEDSFVKELSPKFLKGLNANEQFYWIGLRREEWVYPNRELGSPSTGTVTFWGSKEPGLHGNCSIIEKTGDGHYEWRVVTCSSKYQAVCLSEYSRYRTEPSRPVRTTGLPEASTIRIDIWQNGSFVGVLSTAVLFGTACCLLIVILIKLYRQLQRVKRNDHPRRTELDRPPQPPLAAQRLMEESEHQADPGLVRDIGEPREGPEEVAETRM